MNANDSANVFPASSVCNTDPKVLWHILIEYIAVYVLNNHIVHSLKFDMIHSVLAKIWLIRKTN